jgi:pimeloyl-ACP methyl ester carboxylesterase
MPTVERDGVPIYFEEHGSGEPLLLLMGLGTDAHAWEWQVPDFAAGHRVILVDNRGIGRSGKPPGPYTTALLAEDARAVLDRVGAVRAHVVGVSMGGMIAQELALAHPGRVGALVLACTYARPGREIEATSTEGAQRIGAASPFELLARGGIDFTAIDVKQLLEFMMPLVHSPQFLVEKREWLRAMFERSLGYGFSLPAFLGQVAAAMEHDTRARLPSLRAPTLVITGTADRLVPARHSDELASLIPGARLLRIDGAAHGLPLEHPERFNRAVLEFIAEHPL